MEFWSWITHQINTNKDVISGDRWGVDNPCDAIALQVKKLLKKSKTLVNWDEIQVDSETLDYWLL